MKKLLILGLFTFMLCGCGGGQAFDCTINGEGVTVTLKDNGMVYKYVVDGKEATQEEIDEINGEYFTGVTSLAEGKQALGSFIQTKGGNCNLD